MDSMDNVSNCEKCSEKYANFFYELYKWCKQCQMNDLKKINQTSGNEKIDDFIQEMQLKINNYDDIIFEWIPYNQFINVKEIGIDNVSRIYSATWKDGPLNYNTIKMKCERHPNKKVGLKLLCNSQNIANEFLNSEV